MISFQIAGMVIIIVILTFYLSQKRLTLRSGQLFVVAAFFVSILLVVDIYSIYCIVNESKFDAHFTNFLCKLYLVILTMVSTLGFIYIIRDIYKYRPITKRIYYAILVTFIVISAIFIFATNIEKYYDGNNILYTSGPSCMICYAVCGTVLLSTILATVVKRKDVTIGKSRTILAWMFIWILAATIQFFVKELLIVSFASSIGLVIIYIMLENPALAIDKETGSFNSIIFDEFMTELFDTRKSFKLVYITLHDNNQNVELRTNALVHLSDLLSTFFEKKIFTSRNNYFTFRTEYGFVVVLRNVEISDFFTRFDPLLSDFNKKYDKAFDMKYLLFNNSEIVSDYKGFKSLLKEVLDNSDIVTYKNDKYYIDATTIKKIENNILMENIIKNSIENNAIEVFYQPIYSKAKNKITSAEALVRIRDNNGLLIYPNSFIELAEKNGLITKIGEIVFTKVCEFINKYDLDKIGIEYIEVNLSVVQCGDINLADKYIKIMKDNNVDPSKINLEITETASTNLRKIMIDNMNKLIEFGTKFSLDDFGMGNSNLNYIIEMPVNIVKFDRVLVNSYFTDEKAKLVMTRIIEMIKALNLEIVLEGIETKESLNEVLNLDIDFIQGYYFSMPVREIDFIKYVSKFNKK